MLMPMDALMMCAVEEEKNYDPADPEFFWGALFRELGNHSDASSLITTNENWELQVPRQVAQEFATGLFADYSDLLAVPDSFLPSSATMKAGTPTFSPPATEACPPLRSFPLPKRRTAGTM